MTSVDEVQRSFAILQENLAFEIAKQIGSTDIPPPEGYATSNQSPQSLSQTLASLRLPTTTPDPADQATIQTFFKNFANTNPTIVQMSLSSAFLAAMEHMSDTLPTEVASQQGYTKEDAAQLAATSLPANRLQNGTMPPLQQVAGGESRAELWEGRQDPSAAPQRNEQAGPVTKHDVANDLKNSLQNATEATQTAQAADTGIIPSFVLNAAMLPGWPIPNQTAMAEFVAKTKMSEEEMLKQLANMGANAELIEKLRKKKPRVGKKLLVYLAMFLTAVETVVSTVANELEALSGEEKNLKETRERANSRGHGGSRQHVYVE